MAALAIMLIGVVLMDRGGSGTIAEARTAAVPSPTPAVPPPTGLSARLTSTESEALEGMALGMDSLRVAFDVERVPAMWLEGAYLADAGQYPEVRYFWERYRTYVEQVRVLESELFRRHFMAKLAEESVNGPMVSIRLARALRVFESRRPQREAVYLSMMELSNASLDFHDLLEERALEIAYEPVSAGFSREPVLEAVALTPELNDTMNRMLDRILVAIEGVYGERIAPREELAGALARRLASQGS